MSMVQRDIVVVAAIALITGVAAGADETPAPGRDAHPLDD
jgi:hypothetical protein